MVMMQRTVSMWVHAACRSISSLFKAAESLSGHRQHGGCPRFDFKHELLRADVEDVELCWEEDVSACLRMCEFR